MEGVIFLTSIAGTTDKYKPDLILLRLRSEKIEMLLERLEVLLASLVLFRKGE